MAGNKTKPTTLRVSDFLKSVKNPTRRADARKVASMMRRITGQRARMWGTSMVGYGKYSYQYASGHKGEWMLTGFSPRKQNLAIYIMPGFEPFLALVEKLGKHKTGKSCLYINSLDDVDEQVLEKLIAESVKLMKKRHGVKS
jgi:hypothetical protein